MQYKYNPFEFNILSTPNREIAMWVTKLSMYSNQYNEFVKNREWPVDKIKTLEKNFDAADSFLSAVDKRAGNCFSVVLRIVQHMVKYNSMPRPPYSCTREQIKALCPVENDILENLKLLPRSSVTDAWRKRCIVFYRNVRMQHI